MEFADRILNQTREKLDTLSNEGYLPDVGKILENVPQDKTGKLLLSAKVLSVVFGVSMVIIGEREDRVMSTNKHICSSNVSTSEGK